MRSSFLLLIFVSSIASAQIASQKIADVTSLENAGVSVAINPKNSKVVVAYVAGKIKYSNDQGTTWQESSFKIPGDLLETPVIVSNARGGFSILYTSANQLTYQHSTDDGKTWSDPVQIAPSPGKVQYNPGICPHQKGDELMVTWTEAEQPISTDDNCRSNIMMAEGSGKKWSAPIVVNENAGNCADDDLTVRASQPMIAFDNKIFIEWASQNAMFYDRSYDGKFWISTDLAITEQKGGWAANVPGFGKVANTPIFAGDNSPSRMKGTLFLTFADQRAGENDGDIWLIRSVVRGDNWTSPARINQDKPGNWQFSPRMALDQANGQVFIVYYDRRDYKDNQTDVYLAWSADGGNQFKEKKITEKPFMANIDSKTNFNNFISVAAREGVAVVLWTANNEIWSAVVKQSDLK